MKTLCFIALAFPLFCSAATVQGIVRQAECHRSGLGIVELMKLNGKTLELSWYRVNSLELCAPSVESAMFFGKTGVLINLASEHTISSVLKLTVFEVNQQGEIVAIGGSKKVDGYKYSHGHSDVRTKNVAEVHNWFYSRTVNR